MADAVTEKDCRLSKWDVVDYLDSEENIAEYLEAVAETGDSALMMEAINDVARVRGRK